MELIGYIFAYLSFFIAVIGFGCEIIDAIKERRNK